MQLGLPSNLKLHVWKIGPDRGTYGMSILPLDELLNVSTIEQGLCQNAVEGILSDWVD